MVISVYWVWPRFHWPEENLIANPFTLFNWRILFSMLQSKNPAVSANSDQNFTVGIVILHFSQWERNLRDFLPPETNYRLISPVGRGLTRLWHKGVLNQTLNQSSLANVGTDSLKHWSVLTLLPLVCDGGNRIKELIHISDTTATRLFCTVVMIIS